MSVRAATVHSLDDFADERHRCPDSEVIAFVEPRFKLWTRKDWQPVGSRTALVQTSADERAAKTIRAFEPPGWQEKPHAA
jgi:hypothetical protein